ncbi:MAG TPA: TIGR00299 family protein, partial [Dehalococcoidia bacterium]|nr:TIGR00299 family protein [Dehalococcoidia bacterium]
LGYAQERLFAIGALDVWNTPIQMKKNRPGTVLSVLVPKDKEREASELILRETPTLGIRIRNVDRYVAGREMTTIQTDMGPVAVKVKLLDGRPVSAAPEPDEVGRVARETGRPFQEVYQRVTEEARRQLL